MPGEEIGEPIIASSSRETESVSTIPCAICRRQFSRYTCPRCNIPYCSLVCFRSEKHGECSESFYRKEVELDVKNAPSANVEEKRRMMELLQRFEEDSLDDSPLLGGSDNEDDDDEDDLHHRLQNVDLDSASYDELWNALTPAERDKFLRALQDPGSDLAKQLASEAIQREQVKPWWEAPLAPTSEESDSLTDGAAPRIRRTKPTIMSLPEALMKRSSDASVNGPLLLYNICAVCIAYAYAIRHFAIPYISSLSSEDPDRVEIRQSISQLVPFLVDRKSTTLHTSLSGVVTDLWSRFPPGHMDPKFFSLLLQDTARLLRPAKLTVIASVSNDPTQNVEGHRSADALRALSDLATLFGDPAATTSAKPNHVVHKLMFYAAYVLGTPAPMLRVMADEAAMRAKTLESESAKVASSGGGGSGSFRRMQSNPGGPRIEEL